MRLYLADFKLITTTTMFSIFSFQIINWKNDIMAKVLRKKKNFVKY